MPLFTDGVAKEGLSKFNPRPGRELNPGPPGWQSEILPTVPTSHSTVVERGGRVVRVRLGRNSIVARQVKTYSVALLSQ